MARKTKTPLEPQPEPVSLWQIAGEDALFLQNSLTQLLNDPNERRTLDQDTMPAVLNLVFRCAQMEELCERMQANQEAPIYTVGYRQREEQRKTRQRYSNGHCDVRYPSGEIIETDEDEE